MDVLIGCEFSGIVREAFRKRGHNAWSCDLLDTEIPGQHIKGNVFDYLEGLPLCTKKEFCIMKLYGLCEFKSSQTNRCPHMNLIKWDLVIFHPPCTFLSGAGNGLFKNNPQRKEQRKKAFEFFMQLVNAPIPKICVENPQGYPNRHYRKPDQTVDPYHFGGNEKKRTCLWLKNLPKLVPLALYRKPKPKGYYGPNSKNPGKAIYFTDMIPGSSISGKLRSKTFSEIAEAMAEQWG